MDSPLAAKVARDSKLGLDSPRPARRNPPSLILRAPSVTAMMPAGILTVMQHRPALALCLTLLACAGTDDGSGTDVPSFTGPTPAAPGAPPAPAPVGAVPPAAGAPAAGVADPNDEAGVTPGSFLPSGAGGAASSAGNSAAGSAAAPSTSAGGSAGAEPSGAAGSATAAAGAGDAPPTDAPAGQEPPPPPPAPPSASACPPNALFCDDFEDDAAGQFPGAPWQNNTGSGATVLVDSVQAFSGSQAVHVNAPPNGAYRRGYFSLEQGSSNIFPAASREMFGRAMMYLDATPNALVHWTIIQAEGRAADNTHDAYYRYGGQQQNGAGLMANYETNSGVSTDCYSHSATRMPVQRWACFEWHFDAARNEMQLWLDGTELTDMHVVDRPTTAGSGCLGNGVNGEWLAPPAFTALHLGWESYQAASNDRNLWVDDVAIASERVGCPAQ
jgi:polysaccharide lyase-like protein